MTARVRTRGAFPQLDARLWDVAPNGTQVLVSHGAYRFAPGEKRQLANRSNRPVLVALVMANAPPSA